MPAGESFRSVATFEARCADCGNTFPAPLLGDFSYGEFLLFGRDGTAYAYLNALNHPMWELADSVIQPADGDAIVRALAAVADPVAGQALCPRHVCPACHSQGEWESWPGRRVGSVDIPTVTFVVFSRLPEEEKRRLLRRHAVPPDRPPQ